MNTNVKLFCGIVFVNGAILGTTITSLITGHGHVVMQLAFTFITLVTVVSYAVIINKENTKTLEPIGE